MNTALAETYENHSRDWTALARFGFRFIFCYLLFFAFGSGNDSLLYIVPKIGAKVSGWLSLTLTTPAVWLAHHYFHVTGVGADIHTTGSGDTAINWIALGLMFIYALIAALVWSVFDSRLEYRTAAAWLRFILRLTLVIAMANYGFSKLFPMQMPPPSLAVLNEPVGNMSPMTLLWTFIGANPAYEMLCGAIEVTAAVLLFFRRTVLAGAILTCFVMSNVLFFNLFFNVPVKIYSAHLVLFSIAVIAPDLQALWDFFWKHKAAAPSAPAAPRHERRALRVTVRVIEVMVALMVLASTPGHYQSYARTQASLLRPHAFTGQWHIDGDLGAINATSGQDAPGQVLTGDGRPMTDLFLEPNGRATLRDSAGVLWRAGFHIQDEGHSFILFREVGEPLSYSFSQPDPTHLVLSPSVSSGTSVGAIRFTRVPLPAHYLLLDREFHLVNEWPLER